MKVSLDTGKAVDALVSELQRQNWGFRSDYSHHDGQYGAMTVSDRRQPSPVTPQVLHRNTGMARNSSSLLFLFAACCVRTCFTNCGWTYSNAGVNTRCVISVVFLRQLFSCTKPYFSCGNFYHSLLVRLALKKLYNGIL